MSQDIDSEVVAKSVRELPNVVGGDVIVSAGFNEETGAAEATIRTQCVIESDISELAASDTWSFRSVHETIGANDGIQLKIREEL